MPLKYFNLVFPLCCLLLVVQSHAGADSLREVEKSWQTMVRAGEKDKASKKCKEWSKNKNKKIAAEAHKCLGNLALVRYVGVISEGTPKHIASFETESVKKATALFSRGLDLSPYDQSMHEGRLFATMASHIVSEMPSTLADSLRRTKQHFSSSVWLPYAKDLMKSELFSITKAYLDVLEKTYPNDLEIEILRKKLPKSK